MVARLVRYGPVRQKKTFLQKLPEDTGDIDLIRNARAKEKNKALIAINEAVAPWMLIVFQLQGDARSRKISSFWKTPTL